MTIRVRGGKTLARFARFLLTFGTFAGVGIKTAMGMGYIRVAEERGNPNG